MLIVLFRQYCLTQKYLRQATTFHQTYQDHLYVMEIFIKTIQEHMSEHIQMGYGGISRILRRETG